MGAAIRSIKTTRFSTPNVVYSDFTNDFEVHPDTGDLFIVTNDNDIKQSLRNLVFTNLYERFYNPQCAGNMMKALFEQDDPNTLYAIQNTLESAIKINEPRVNLLGIKIQVSGTNPWGVNISIRYTDANNPGAQLLNIFVERVR